MLNRTARVCLSLTALFILVAPTLHAGDIGLAWKLSPGASSYRVYYGPSESQLDSSFPVFGGTTTQTTVSGLGDCATWYFAVSASNSAGESALTPAISSLPRPRMNAPSPSSAMQGSQFTLSIVGANFESGTTLEIDNPRMPTQPDVFLDSVSVSSCNLIEAAATVEATSPGVRAAEVGQFTVTVTTPNGLEGAGSFEVLIDPSRFDINQSEPVTTDRLEGRDTIWLRRQAPACQQPAIGGCPRPDLNPAPYNPDYDFNGDGWVDGEDLALLVGGGANLGSCWNGSSWSLSACPASLQ